MLEIRKYGPEDVEGMREVWNEVVREGVAFPQLDELTSAGAREFFAAQDYCAAAVEDGRVLGMYILHPNNVGRCGHQANASYAVASHARGRRVGEALVQLSPQPVKTAAEEK